MIHFLLGARPAYFQGRTVSVREGNSYENTWNELTQFGWYDQEIVSWFWSQIWIHRSDHPISPFVGYREHDQQRNSPAQEILPAQCVAWQQIDDP